LIARFASATLSRRQVDESFALLTTSPRRDERLGPLGRVDAGSSPRAANHEAAHLRRTDLEAELAGELEVALIARADRP
jgi:hypothetical protein